MFKFPLAGTLIFCLLTAFYLQAGVTAEHVKVFEEDFAAGIPGTWRVINAGCSVSFWRTDNPRAASFEGLTEPFALIDCWNNLSGAYWDESLETPGMDFSDAEEVVLRFSQYMYADASQTASVDIRIGSGNWQTVKEFLMNESGQDEIDLTALAAGHDNVRLRWYFADTSGQAFGVWAVDDVEIWVLEKPYLVLDLPVFPAENAGNLASGGRITRNRYLDSTLTAVLTSDQPGAVDLPAAVTFNPGETSRTFDILVYDNSDPARQISVNVNLTASGYPGISGRLYIVDEDTDADSLGDDWELFYLGGIAAEPDADDDGDGFSNLVEYSFGTDPSDAASAPAEGEGTAAGCQPGAGGIGAWSWLVMVLAGIGARRGRQLRA